MAVRGPKVHSTCREIRNGRASRRPGRAVDRAHGVREGGEVGDELFAMCEQQLHVAFRLWTGRACDGTLVLEFDDRELAGLEVECE